MKTILCFGDSNTYGHLPADGSKMDKPWPKVLGEIIGAEGKVIEEGQCGRTTAYAAAEDPQQSGMDRFRQIIEQRTFADVLVIMLGTNDLLSDFDRLPQESAANLREYARLWRGAFGEEKRILIISPPHITEAFTRHEYFKTVYPPHAARRSEMFSEQYRRLCDEEGLDFLDAAEVSTASDKDGIHLEPEEHIKLAKAVYAKLCDMGIFGNGAR